MTEAKLRDLREKCLRKFIKYYESEYEKIHELYEEGMYSPSQFVDYLKELNRQKDFVLSEITIPLKQDS